MKLNCIVIEDEPLARKGLEGFIKKIPHLNFLAAFSNPLPATETLKSELVDLIFLDIKMPEMSGLSFLKTLEKPPAVIITTAYPNYAVQGFELNVTDYLLKPFSFDRFLAAVNKVKYKAEPEKIKEDFVFIKCKNKIEKILYDDILFIQAMENYVIIQTVSRKYVSYLTLKGVEDFLPESLFVKVHKSYIIAVSKVDSIEGNTLFIGKHSIQFNRNHKNEILNSIVKNKLLKR